MGNSAPTTRSVYFARSLNVFGIILWYHRSLGARRQQFSGDFCRAFQLPRLRAFPVLRLQCVSSLLLVLSAAAGLYGQGTGPRSDGRIRAAVDVSPDLIGLSSASTVLLTISNQNTASNQSLQPGDSFRLDFDLGDGRIDTLPDAVVTTSSTLTPAYFTVGPGAGPLEIVITYQGPPALFGSTGYDRSEDTDARAQHDTRE